MIDDILRDEAWKPFEDKRGTSSHDDRARRRLRAAVAVVVVGAVATRAAAQFARADTAALRRTLDGIAKAHHGVLGYSVMNLDTGERLSLRGDETFSTASLIKVPILVTLYDLAEKKQLSLDDPLTVLKIDQVPGSGVLQFMQPGMTLSVNDAASLMIVLSDNTATNLLLDRIAIRRVWDEDGSARPAAHEGPLEDIPADHERRDGQLGEVRLGVSTPNEMAQLFELLAQGKAVSPGRRFGDARHSVATTPTAS